jgi:hypothetical protein
MTQNCALEEYSSLEFWSKFDRNLIFSALNLTVLIEFSGKFSCSRLSYHIELQNSSSEERVTNIYAKHVID